jgi:poly(ADP-ribose) glycohydrolase ARH3
MATEPVSSDKIFGSLIGSIFADALGARFEGVTQQHLRSSFQDKSEVLERALSRQSLRYTDDGQMTLVVAEYLTRESTIVSHRLMQQFVDAYESWRGYGRGARVLIEAFRDDAEYEYMAEHLFPGGSLGNGAAMRSAPVGLKFHGCLESIWLEAKNCAWPTHRHELGIEGAQLIAATASLALSDAPIDPMTLADYLQPFCRTTVFQNSLAKLRHVELDRDIDQFGNGIEAHESVVTALACFALYPDDYHAALATALWQGGDTDTIAAMTGALVGARVGAAFTESLPIDRLEDGRMFVQYVVELAKRLAVR